MFWLLLIFVLVLAFFPYVRYYIFHLHITLPVTIKDIYYYVRHKKYNECKEIGKVFMFTAADSQAFGSGKTLSMVQWLRFVYKRYNNLDVWDEETKKFVKQKIIIISNVELSGIPYIPFIGRSQFVEIDKLPYSDHDIVIFCIDEAGMEFNSRQYRDNLPTSFLQRLLQCRHNRVSFVLTSQRFAFTDKVIRSICGTVTTCKKIWRIVRLQDFDAYTLENCSNPEMVMPICTRWYFADDKLYNSYDTTYNVQKLKEELEAGQLLNTEEIIQRIGESGNTPEVVRSKFRRRFRKGK